MLLMEENSWGSQTAPVEYEKHLHKRKHRSLEHFNFGYLMLMEANDMTCAYHQARVESYLGWLVCYFHMLYHLRRC